MSDINNNNPTTTSQLITNEEKLILIASADDEKEEQSNPFKGFNMGMIQTLMKMRDVENDQVQIAMAESLQEHENQVKVEAELENIKKYYSSLLESKEIPKATGNVTDDFDLIDQPDNETEDYIDENVVNN